MQNYNCQKNRVASKKTCVPLYSSLQPYCLLTCSIFCIVKLCISPATYILLTSVGKGEEMHNMLGHRQVVYQMEEDWMRILPFGGKSYFCGNTKNQDVELTDTRSSTEAACEYMKYSSSELNHWFIKVSIFDSDKQWLSRVSSSGLSHYLLSVLWWLNLDLLHTKQMFHH